VLTEAPWIDYIVRGEGEEIVVNLVTAIAEGRYSPPSANHQGASPSWRTAKPTATPATRRSQDLDSLVPDWGILNWSRYIYIPLNCRVAIPNFARGCPFTCSFCSQWKFWRTVPHARPEEVRGRDRDAGEGAQGRLLHPRRRRADDQPQEVRRTLRGAHRSATSASQWGINTRVTDILRDEALLPLYRKAGLVHVSLGTEAAAQLKLDRFNKEIKLEQSKKAIQLLRRTAS
jgi:anaerobic magnesium-protoporphyrin IX monomethyl ester cyclase